MRLALAIATASLAYSVLTAAATATFIGHLDATLLQRVAVALH